MKSYFIDSIVAGGGVVGKNYCDDKLVFNVLLNVVYPKKTSCVSSLQTCYVINLR